MSDFAKDKDVLISRQAAVSRMSDLIMIELKGGRLPSWNEVYSAMQDLPSVQPEIIRCKDCKHRPSGTGANHDLEFPDDRCPCKCEDYWYSWKPDDNWFCGNGERGR